MRSLGWVLTTRMRSPRATSRSSSSVPVVLEDLEHAAVDQRPLRGEQRLVVGQQTVAGGQELAEDALLVEHDVTQERPVGQHVEPFALADLVDDQLGELLGGQRTTIAQEPARLGVQPAGPVVEAVGLPPEVARLVLAARPARARIVAACRRAGPVGGEPLDLVPQQLAVVAIVVVELVVVVTLRLHTGLDEQPQRARRVAAVGAEPGQIDQRRTVPAGAVDRRLQQRRPRRPPPRHDPAPGPAARPARSTAAWSALTCRPARPASRRGHHVARARPTPPRRPGRRRARADHAVHVDQVVARRRVVGGEELGRQVGLRRIESVRDPETVPGLPRVQGVPVEALGGDQPVALDEAGRRVQVGQRRDRVAAERRAVDEQRLVDRARPELRTATPPASARRRTSGRHRCHVPPARIQP